MLAVIAMTLCSGHFGCSLVGEVHNRKVSYEVYAPAAQRQRRWITQVAKIPPVPYCSLHMHVITTSIMVLLFYTVANMTAPFDNLWPFYVQDISWLSG